MKPVKSAGGNAASTSRIRRRRERKSSTIKLVVLPSLSPDWQVTYIPALFSDVVYVHATRPDLVGALSGVFIPRHAKSSKR
jgi:hypothetical protein